MSNVATIQDLYEAFGRQDVPAILEQLAEDVDWDGDLDVPGVPYIVPRRGREEVAEFFQAVDEALEFRRFEPRSFLEGDGQVAVVIDLEATVRATGKEISDVEIHLWTFGDSGQITALRHVVDTHQHVEANRAA